MNLYVVSYNSGRSVAFNPLVLVSFKIKINYAINEYMEKKKENVINN